MEILAPEMMMAITTRRMATARRSKCLDTRGMPRGPRRSSKNAWMRPPNSESNVPEKPLATLAALRTYSRITLHPMMNASNSPALTYVYVYAEPALGMRAREIEILVNRVLCSFLSFLSV